MQEELTLENYSERTGRRFRVNREQAERIKAGSLTREEAFQEFLANGGTPSTDSTPIPREVLEDPELTLDNFTDFVRERTGQSRRFRVSQEQSDRIKAGTLTREQAFAEWRNSQLENQSQEDEPNALAAVSSEGEDSN